MSLFRSSLRYFRQRPYFRCYGHQPSLPVDRCIAFLYTDPNAEVGQFRLILAANRDEYFRRPAVRAHFWKEYPTIIGGRDMEPGREGGSWCAVSKKGRIAILLNVMGGTFADMKSRGSIVPDYLTAETTPENHLSSLERSAHEFSLFNLLTIDVRREDIDVRQLSNAGDTRRTHASGRGFLGVGNHLLGRPTLKVTAGLDAFKDIVGRVDEKDQLIHKLLALLKCRRKHFPDPVLQSLAPDAPLERLQALSSIFINNNATGYITRAHTIVLIDKKDNVDYHEWAMAEPIQPDNPQWKKQHFTFQLDYSN